MIDNIIAIEGDDERNVIATIKKLINKPDMDIDLITLKRGSWAAHYIYGKAVEDETVKMPRAFVYYNYIFLLIDDQTNFAMPMIMKLSAHFVMSTIMPDGDFFLMEDLERVHKKKTVFFCRWDKSVSPYELEFDTFSEDLALPDITSFVKLQKLEKGK